MRELFLVNFKQFWTQKLKVWPKKVGDFHTKRFYIRIYNDKFKMICFHKIYELKQKHAHFIAKKCHFFVKIKHFVGVSKPLLYSRTRIFIRSHSSCRKEIYCKIWEINLGQSFSNIRKFILWNIYEFLKCISSIAPKIFPKMDRFNTRTHFWKIFSFENYITWCISLFCLFRLKVFYTVILFTAML